MEPRIFGSIDRQPIYEVTISSRGGMRAQIITWGAIVRDLLAPLPGGGQQRLVLGLNSIEDYLQHSPHFGCIVGRFANRIAQGRFTLNGETAQLPLNDRGKHSMHGGGAGFGRRVWHLASFDAISATLTLVSPDGEAGYPGAVSVTCTYRMLEPATLRIELGATCDMPTPVNLSQHSYFNLDGSPDILDHALQIAADFYTPTDSEDIPTGEVRAVQDTAYDFRQPRPVRRMDASGDRVRYDMNFALQRTEQQLAGAGGQCIARAATLASSRNGAALDIWTTEPGLQFYDGFKLNVPVAGLGGSYYRANAGLCLEPQRFPDSPNRSHFPDAILRPGSIYRHLTEYRFRVRPH